MSFRGYAVQRSRAIAFSNLAYSRFRWVLSGHQFLKERDPCITMSFQPAS